MEWFKAKIINVIDINGDVNKYEDVEFRATDKTLIIKYCQLIMVYNFDNVIKYFYQLDTAPLT